MALKTSSSSTKQSGIKYPNDLVDQKVTLWDGAVKVGEAIFANGDNAISSAIANFVVPAGGAKVLTVKGVISGISYAGPLTKSGDMLKVDYDGDNQLIIKR